MGEFDLLIEKPRIPMREILLFGLWPGFVKNWLYRLRGYRIGKNVSIGLGSVICGDRVVVGDHTSIGFLTIVRGKDIEIDAHVQIGSMTFLDTPHLQIGEGSRINEQVFVGGLQFPDSRFVLGRNCLVQQLVFINPSRPILVGNDSGIGGHSLIFTHYSFLSQFEGYDVEFEPVEIGNSVSLGWGVFVMPKTKIGDGAVVGSRSVVHGNIPPRSLAVGFPARVIKKAPEFPKEVTEKEKTIIFRTIIAEMNQFFIGSGLKCVRDGNRYTISKSHFSWWRRNGGSWNLVVVDEDIHQAVQAQDLESIDVLLSLWEIPANIRRELQSKGIMWIEIARKEQSQDSNDLGEEVTNFLKRYGVRTLRIPS